MELLSLKWNTHQDIFASGLCNLWTNRGFTDVTLACERRLYKVHKFVLSICSDYFHEIFENSQSPNLVILLKDIKCKDLDLLLEYMYLGRVNVHQNNLPSLINAAEGLQIKGLTTPDEDSSEYTENKRKSYSDSENYERLPKSRKKTNYGNQSCDKNSKELESDYTSPEIHNSAKTSLKEQDSVDEQLFLAVSDIKTEIFDEPRIGPNTYIQTGLSNSNLGDSKQDLCTDSHEFSSLSSKQNLIENSDSPNQNFNQLSQSQEFHSDQLNFTNETDPMSQSNSSNSDAANTFTEHNIEEASTLWGSATLATNPDSVNMTYGVNGANSNKIIRPDGAIFTDRSLVMNAPKYIFPCSYCGKIFNHKTNHLAHERIHTGEKPFKCIYCPYKCSLKGNLKNHIVCKHKTDWKSIKHLF